MKIIDVPDVPRSESGKESLWCWKQQTDPTKPHMFVRCTLTIGHDTGAQPTPHQWEKP